MSSAPIPPNPLFTDLDASDILPKPKQRSPWVLAGALATAGVLAAGVLAFKSGNTVLSQHMMRARVLTQAATVALMAGSMGGLIATGTEHPAQPAAAAEAK